MGEKGRGLKNNKIQTKNNKQTQIVSQLVEYFKLDYI